MTKKRRKKRRKNLTSQALSARDEAICTLATEGGFYAKTIALALTRRGIPTGTSTVYNVLWENDISLREYRRAKSKLSQARLNTLLSKHFRHSKSSQLRLAS